MDFLSKIFPIVVAAIQVVEQLRAKAPSKEKQDLAVALSASMLATVEGSVGKDLLNNAEVQKAVRNAIDAVVALQNTINAVKAVKPPKAA